MKPFQPKLIVVPTDFSEPAAHALRYASALAERFGSHLLVLYADLFMLPVDYVPATPSNYVDMREESIAQTRDRLEAHVKQNVSTNVAYDTRVIIDEPVTAIIESTCDAGADLIVMGTHGRSGLRRLLVGSVTDAVSRLATTPVIAVNSFTTELPGVHKVLCAVTLGAGGREALRYAADLTDTPNAPLVLLHGIDRKTLSGTLDDLIQLQDWAPKNLVDRCELKIMPESVPADEIVHFAKQTSADLIALAIPDHRSITDVLRGTTAEQILRASDCPVLLVNESVAQHRQLDRERELASV